MFSIFLQGVWGEFATYRRILRRSMIKACPADLLPEMENQFWFIGKQSGGKTVPSQTVPNLCLINHFL